MSVYHSHRNTVFLLTEPIRALSGRRYEWHKDTKVLCCGKDIDPCSVRMDDGFEEIWAFRWTPMPTYIIPHLVEALNRDTDRRWEYYDRCLWNPNALVSCPKVGDDVSVSIGNETFPAGKIVSIGKGKRQMITVTDGRRFATNGNGVWHQTPRRGSACLVYGHHTVIDYDR